MNANSNQDWAVVIADIVDSTHVASFKQLRDRVLGQLSQQHLAEHRVLARYTVTAWDEFQNVLATPVDIPHIIWDLRVAFFPVEIRVGIGLGHIDDLPDSSTTPINEVSSGEAFFSAREAISQMEGDGGKFERRTILECRDVELKRTVNLFYLLSDSLMTKLSQRQMETIQAYEKTQRLDAAKAILGIDSDSTVSRNLQRAFYWQLKESQQQLKKVLQHRIAPPYTNN